MRNFRKTVEIVTDSAVYNAIGNSLSSKVLNLAHFAIYIPVLDIVYFAKTKYTNHDVTHMGNWNEY